MLMAITSVSRAVRLDDEKKEWNKEWRGCVKGKKKSSEGSLKFPKNLVPFFPLILLLHFISCFIFSFFLPFFLSLFLFLFFLRFFASFRVLLFLVFFSWPRTPKFNLLAIKTGVGASECQLYSSSIRTFFSRCLKE